jgi:Fur family ferric uptake transcriptional regulator
MERSTRQRSAIRTAVDNAGRPLLAQEVLEQAQQEVPGIGLATIYRNLKSLVEAEELKVVQLPGENPRYERVGHSHHHHFQCRQCNRVFDVHACPGNLAKLAPEGFSVEDHELTLYGRCADCSVALSSAMR